MWGQRSRTCSDEQPHLQGHQQYQQKKLPVVVDHVTKEQAAMDQGVLYRLPPEGHEFPPAYSEEARPAHIQSMKVDSFICEPTKTFRSGSLSTVKSVSVKDRIALFSQAGPPSSQMSRGPTVPVCNTLPRSPCNSVRITSSTNPADLPDRKATAPLNRWHSTTSLVPSERRSSYVSTYPEAQLLKRPGYERSSSSSTLLSSFLQERQSSNASKLKGLIIPEGPSKQSTATAPLPLIGPSASWRPAPLVQTSFQLSHSKPVTPPVPERPVLVSPVRSSISSSSPPPPLPPTSPPPLPPVTNEPISSKSSSLVEENDLVSCFVDPAKPYRNPIERLDSLLGTKTLPSNVKMLSSPENSPPDSGPNSIPEVYSSTVQHNSTPKSSLSPQPSNTPVRSNSTPNSVESSSNRSRFWSLHDESDDDSNSIISLRTEDSRQTADDSLSDADSLHQEHSEFRPRRLSQQRTVLSSTVITAPSKPQTTDSVSQFRALAEKWEARSLTNGSPVVPNSTTSVSSSFTNISNSFSNQSSTNTRSPRNGIDTSKLPPSLQPRSALQDTKSVLPLLERSLSSLDLVESRLQKSSRSVSISDIRKSFETKKQVVEHKRFSSMDSTASDSGVGTPGGLYGSASSLHAGNQSLGVDGFGSGTSLASDDCCLNTPPPAPLPDPTPTPVPPPTNNQTILEEAASLLKVEPGECQLETITLKKDIPQGSVGITLAGGADYEVKEITVHKVITGGLADRDGRLQKGDHILSINGQLLQGLTHRQALDLLKAHQPEVVLVISKGGTFQNCFEVQTKSPLYSSSDKARKSTQPAAEEEKGANKSVPTPSSLKEQGDVQLPPGAVKLHLLKDGAGLGFSLEGGQGSPLGDRPLTVKRVFKGGAADQEGHLKIGDQVLFIGNQSVSSMTRTEAWNYMKKFPDGPVTLTVRPLLGNTLPN